MSTEQITYDRIWLQGYIERISYEKELVSELYDILTGEMYRAPAMQRTVYEEMLSHARNLLDTLTITCQALERYLEQAEEAGAILRRRCLDTEIPEFFG